MGASRPTIWSLFSNSWDRDHSRVWSRQPRGARECGFTATGVIVDAVLALSPANFYKTMEAERCPGLWQDVYHSAFHGVDLYIKLQISPEGIGVVVQFKER